MKIIILGAGQAGFMTAKTLRDNAPDIQIQIFDLDTAGLYAKMRLPEFVAGVLPEAKLILSNEEAFRKMNIEPFFGVKIVAVQPEKHLVKAEDGREFPYDKLVFATGANAFVPPVKGLDRVESFTLRTLEDARKIAAKADAGGNPSALVVGGGLLGLETAWALRQRGFAVTVSEFMDRLLPKQLNEAQSAILLQKLTLFREEIELRQTVAANYAKALEGLVQLPTVAKDCVSVWAQFCPRSKDFAKIQAALKEGGIPSARYYPIPMHLLKAMAYLGYRKGDMPVAEAIAEDIFALPMHPYLDAETISSIGKIVRGAL